MKSTPDKECIHREINRKTATAVKQYYHQVRAAVFFNQVSFLCKERCMHYKYNLIYAKNETYCVKITH